MTETTPAERRERYAAKISKGGFGQSLRELTDAAIAVADAEQAELRARLTDYENRITWGTTCGSCARVLDSSIRETERAERAEAAVARVRSLHDHLDSETDLLASPDQEITRGAAARKIAAALDGYSPPADRAAILAEVEGVIRAEIHACGYSLEAGCEFCNGVTTVLEKVRRLADAASGPGGAAGEQGPVGSSDLEEAGPEFKESAGNLNLGRADGEPDSYAERVNAPLSESTITALNQRLQAGDIPVHTVRRRAGGKTQRPRCPHCQMPHDLTPDVAAVCASIRASIAADEAQQDGPVRHAPGKAILCPDCRAKGYTVCMEPAAVSQPGKEA